MKFAISETYLFLKKIEEYQKQNHTGFRKICKKHDKILVRDTGKKFMTETIATAAFWTDKELFVLISEYHFIWSYSDRFSHAFGHYL